MILQKRQAYQKEIVLTLGEKKKGGEKKEKEQFRRDSLSINFYPGIRDGDRDGGLRGIKAEIERT